MVSSLHLGRTSIALQHLDSSSSASWTHGGASATMPFAFPLPCWSGGDSIAEGLDRKRTVSGAVTSCGLPSLGWGTSSVYNGRSHGALEPTVKRDRTEYRGHPGRFAQGF